jgi:transposase-like protein
MIEYTLTELGLLIWAILVTGFFIDAKREALTAREFILHFIENDEDREKFVRDCKKARSEYQARVNKL